MSAWMKSAPNYVQNLCRNWAASVLTRYSPVGLRYGLPLPYILSAASISC